MRLIVTISILIILCSCGSVKNAARPDHQESDKQMIIFHDFLVYHLDGEVNIDERDKVLRDGTVKEFNRDPMGMLHPIEVIFLDRSSNRLKSIYIEHPLIDELEYAGDNDELRRITVYRDSVIFTLRYNFVDGLDQIIFSSMQEDTLEVLQQLKLKR